MDKEYERLAEKKISSEEIFDGRIMHIFRDSIELPNGERGIREVMRHIGAVCVVPVTDDGNVILERQFRYPMNEVITEIPAGKLDSREEDPLEAAKRELKEETGYEAGRWKPLGMFYSAPAYSDEKIMMYLAQDLKKGSQKLDQDEFLEVFEMPLKQALSMVMEGLIPDSKTQTGLLKAANVLGVC